MPVKKSAKPREAERDYSHRLLVDKLGIKAGQRISVMGVESAEFLVELAARVPEYSRGKLLKDADLIFFSSEAKQDLTRLKSLAGSIQPNGAIWVVYPKGQKHIREIDVIAAAKSGGLVDNKVCSFSTTHTALRLCIPVANR
jgi:hypothetical protein